MSTIKLPIIALTQPYGWVPDAEWDLGDEALMLSKEQTEIVLEALKKTSDDILENCHTPGWDDTHERLTKAITIFEGEK